MPRFCRSIMTRSKMSPSCSATSRSACRRMSAKGCAPCSMARGRDDASQPSASNSSATCSTCSPSRSEEHTSELQSLMRISYAVFCLKKKKNTNTHTHTETNIISQEKYKNQDVYEDIIHRST